MIRGEASCVTSDRDRASPCFAARREVSAPRGNCPTCERAAIEDGDEPIVEHRLNESMGELWPEAPWH
jgi:hypothetical protein